MIVSRVRSTEPELMDGEGFDLAEYERTLREIETINVLTNGYAPTLRAVEELAKRASKKRLRVLDIGFGYGDTLRHLAKWSRKKGIELELVGVDLNPWAKDVAERATPKDLGIEYRTRDMFELGDEKFDIVVNALFMHHLTDAQVVTALRWMTAHAGIGWFINDLHRHPIAYHFIKHATRLASSSRLIKHDAPVSVARAFRSEDWRRFARKAGIPEGDIRIRWHFPFRYGVMYVRHR